MPNSFVFRSYEAADRTPCLGLFDENCPAFFAPNEQLEYEIFLAESSSSYEVCVLDGRLIGAFGVQPGPNHGLSLRWILVSSHVHGQGVGAAIMTRVIDQVRARSSATLRIAASHKSAPFFEKFGARETGKTLDGWGPGMHRVDMLLSIS